VCRFNSFRDLEIISLFIRFPAFIYGILRFFIHYFLHDLLQSELCLEKSKFFQFCQLKKCLSSKFIMINRKCGRNAIFAIYFRILREWITAQESEKMLSLHIQWFSILALSLIPEVRETRARWLFRKGASPPSTYSLKSESTSLLRTVTFQFNFLHQHFSYFSIISEDIRIHIFRKLSFLDTFIIYYYILVLIFLPCV